MQDEESKKELLENVNSIIVNIMFCTASRTPVTLKNNNKNKYLYILYCLQIADTDKYILFNKNFKILKRKNKLGTYFSLNENTTNVFEGQKHVENYLNNFLLSYNEHERIFKEIDIEYDNAPAGDVLLEINKAENDLFTYFNELTYTNK